MRCGLLDKAQGNSLLENHHCCGHTCIALTCCLGEHYLEVVPSGEQEVMIQIGGGGEGEGRMLCNHTPLLYEMKKSCTTPDLIM